MQYVWDDQIDTTDIPPLDDRFFATVRWRMPKPQVSVLVQVEPDVLDWFKAQGENYERYLSAALRISAQAHQVPE